ncbi:MAG: hypothetical protein IKJ04_04250 [Clostridia bacterium]|nr:hypothetical protein [Clostridia bacterium]
MQNAKYGEFPRVARKFSILLKDNSGKVLVKLFQKLVGQGQSPCRTPQSAEFSLALQTDCVPQAVWKE